MRVFPKGAAKRGPHDELTRSESSTIGFWLDWFIYLFASEAGRRFLSDLRSANIEISHDLQTCWFLGPFFDGGLVSGRCRHTRLAAKWSKINWLWGSLRFSRYVDSLDHSLMVVWSWAASGAPGQQLSDLRSVDSLDHSLMVIWSWVLDSTGVGANSGDPRNYSPNSWLWNHFTELEFSEFETGNVEKTETIRSRFIRGVWKCVRMHATARQYTYTYKYYTYTISGNYRRRSQRHLQVQW